MIRMKIKTCCWEEGVLELSGLPEKHFPWTRDVVVMDFQEYGNIKAKAERTECYQKALIEIANCKADQKHLSKIARLALNPFSKR